MSKYFLIKTEKDTIFTESIIKEVELTEEELEDLLLSDEIKWLTEEKIRKVLDNEETSNTH